MTFSFEVVDDIAMGDSFEVKVKAANNSHHLRTVRVNISSIMAFYTGIVAKNLKQERETLRLEASEGTSLHQIVGYLFVTPRALCRTLKSRKVLKTVI